jgi:hypothetical protein
MNRRAYQKEALNEFIRSNSRFWALLWERQAGKSTTLADFALYEMLRHQNRTVIYGSASLLLASEITLKTAIRANQTIQQLVEGDAARLKHFADTAQSRIDRSSLAPIGQETSPMEPVHMVGTRSCASAPASSNPAAVFINQYYADHQLNHADPGQRGAYSLSCLEPLSNPYDWLPSGNVSSVPLVPASKPKPQFKIFDSANDCEVKKYTLADFTDLFRQQRLEFRVYYEPNSYSRTKVIAPNIATARSWSGTVLLDEVAFIRNLRELITALLPVISTDKQFKLILSTTPPEFDDTHYSFELLAPPAGLQFVPRPEGNWYTSESGVRVHRADAFDTALAGKKIFDLKTGEEISPQEAFTRAPNKNGHRIAHWLTWMVGGSAACDMLRLRTAQERGLGQCQNFQINSDIDMTPALNWLHENLGGVAASRQSAANSYLKIGLGFDVATTTKGKSNPSVISIMEEHGPEWVVRARFIWKTREPALANQRISSILDVLERRGIRPRALAQDATNERYYGEQNRNEFRRRLPVLLVVASQAVEKPGLDKPTNWKEFLGNQLVAKLDDNHLTLPPDEYTRLDYRLVMKDRGRFVCEPNDQGMHGDCFDADKLAGHALATFPAGRPIAFAVNVRGSTFGTNSLRSRLG